MSDPIQGRAATLSVRIDGSTYTDILCMSEVTYRCDVELIEKTGPNSTGRERYRRLEDHFSTLSGLTPISSDTVVTFFDVYEQRKAAQSFQITFEDDDGNVRQLTGDGIFGSMGLVANVTAMVNASIDIFWNGEPAITKVGSDTIESG